MSVLIILAFRNDFQGDTQLKKKKKRNKKKQQRETFIIWLLGMWSRMREWCVWREGDVGRVKLQNRMHQGCVKAEPDGVTGTL